MKQHWMLLAAGACLLGGCQKESADANTAAQNAMAGNAAALPAGPAKNPDMTEFVRTVDADGDGHMSRAEWQTQGLPQSSFDMFEKGRGFVTLDDYRANAAPPGIDLDGDGVLTVAEFREFDRQMAARMAADGKAPPPPPPPSPAASRP